ncbi:MAG: NAD-glutamate dehydrogenase, partial [Hyphomicrobiaceae bacterium]|nr:NAD-glutamate dehydrogenase [Hyphomicrobiaceae bacterium]
MAGTARPKQRPFITSVVKSLEGSGASKNRTAFAQGVLLGSHDNDFDGFSPGAVGELMRSAWEFAVKRKPGSHNLRVYNPGDDAGPLSGVTIIEVLNEDMPFLVDSIMGEIQERGLHVQLVLHPVLKVTRDSKYKLKSLAVGRSRASEKEIKESYIHVQVDRIQDEAQRTDLEKTLVAILGDVRTVVTDWRPMLQRLDSAVEAYTTAPPSVPVADLAESIQFLNWLLDNNFTLLGMRTFSFV